MKASLFLAKYDIGYAVLPAERPATEHETPGHPWFRVRFVLPVAHNNRAVDMDWGGAVDDDVNTVSADIAWVFYRMADAARYGESYEELVSDYGTNLHLTREEWEQGQRALRERCRAWLTDDVMWEEFLGVEDDDGHSHN